MSLVAISPVAAQTNEPEPMAVPTEVIEPTLEPEQTPTEIEVSARENTASSIILFAGVALVAFGVFAGVVIRYVSKLVPAELAPVVYGGGNLFYSKRQEFLDSKRDEAAKNAVLWDDAFWDTAVGVAAEDWQRFIDEASAAGVVLSITPSSPHVERAQAAKSKLYGQSARGVDLSKNQG